jgi:hypothetical protein
MIKYLLVLLFVISDNLIIESLAQSAPTAGDHMRYFTDKDEILSRNYLSYMSEVAHGGRARKMEKRRLELISFIKETIREGNRLRPYNNDPSLRNAYIEYWNILLSIFNEDYHKIVDMEEVAEQSYDDMEAYLLAQERANQKLNDANEKAVVAYRAFAVNNKITLTEGKSTTLSKKIKKISIVNSYHRVVFLIFFKARVQENYAIEAYNAKDINALEQRRESLLKYADEGLIKLATLEPFDNDNSLIIAMKKVLEFYKIEATNYFLVFSEYLIKTDEFQKLKKSYDSKSSGKTKEDVDTYNKAVIELNKLMSSVNSISKESNNKRSDLLNNLDSVKMNFMDTYMPYK